MARLFGVAALVLLIGATASASDLRQLTIEINENVILVENAHFSATAQHVSFDAAEELLLLEGSAASPVILTQRDDNKTHEISAHRIRLSLKDGRMVAERVQRIQSAGPH